MGLLDTYMRLQSLKQQQQAQQMNELQAVLTLTKTLKEMRDMERYNSMQDEVGAINPYNTQEQATSGMTNLPYGYDVADPESIVTQQVPKQAQTFLREQGDVIRKYFPEKALPFYKEAGDLDREERIAKQPKIVGTGGTHGVYAIDPTTLTSKTIIDPIADVDKPSAEIKTFQDFQKMTPEQQKEFLKFKQDKSVTFNMPGTGDFGRMPQNEQDVWYTQYQATGTPPPFAFRDAQSRSQFVKGYAEFLKRNGITPTEAMLNRADYAAIKGSLNTQEKQYGMMGGFVKNIDGQITKVEKMMDDTIKRVGLRALDIPIRQLATRFVGSGHEAVLESYLMEISREIGKLATGSQASVAELSVEAQKKWDKVHDPNLSMKDLMEVLKATRDQANIRHTTSKSAIEDTRKRMKEIGQGEPTEQPTPQPKATHKYVPGKGIVPVGGQ